MTQFHRITVIVGHFGSGKSEFAINLGMELGRQGNPFYLADLDIVDPYFRSRECKALLESSGGTLITSSQACMDADVPSLPPEVATVFQDTSRFGILDIGGDPSGARVLARYRRQMAANDTQILCVVNGNRPLSDTAEKAAAYVQRIQEAIGLPITGLVNNTHCCHLTEIDDIRSGAALTEEVSRLLHIPLVCHAVPRHLAKAAEQYVSPIFPMDLYLKKPWEV